MSISNRTRTNLILGGALKSLATMTVTLACGCIQTPQNSARVAETDAQLRAQKSIGQASLPKVPARTVMPIDRNLLVRSQQVIDQSLVSSQAVLRVQAIEVSVRSGQVDLPAVLAKASVDPLPAVRFASAMGAGDAKLVSMKPRLLEMASDTDPHVQVGARYALHRLGDYRYSNQLEKLSQHPSAGVRANVAMVLGKIGEPSASSVLRPMLRDESMPVKLAAAESLWRYQDQQALEMLVAGVSSQFVDDQMVSMIALAANNDRRVLGYLLGRLDMNRAIVDESREGRFYNQVELVASRAAGMLGSDAGFGVARAASSSVDPRERSLAALALGEIGRSDAQPTLAILLADPDANVRLAAASAMKQVAGHSAREALLPPVAQVR